MWGNCVDKWRCNVRVWARKEDKAMKTSDAEINQLVMVERVTRFKSLQSVKWGEEEENYRRERKESSAITLFAVGLYPKEHNGEALSVLDDGPVHSAVTSRRRSGWIRAITRRQKERICSSFLSSGNNKSGHFASFNGPRFSLLVKSNKTINCHFLPGDGDDDKQSSYK